MWADAVNINFQGLCYLAAWDRGISFDAGMAHDTRLRCFTLDYSWDSLSRIDTFLDQLREAEHPQAATFLDDPRNQNLLYFLAFYTGEVRARSMSVKSRWANWDELLEMDPGMQVLGAGFHSSLVQISPGLFLPLASISARLFDETLDKSIAFSAGMELEIPPALASIPASAPLPPIPAQSLMRSYPDRFAQLPHARRTAYLALLYPDWPPAEVDRMKAAVPALLQDGRMVWAATILANGALYDGSAAAAPAEIVYDPRGMVEPEGLNSAAGMLLSLRGKAHTSPELLKYAAHLDEHATPLLDWKTPPELMPYPLSTCTLLVTATALPGRRLAMKNFPVLVSDRHPGVAMVAPQELWPAALLKEWLAELPPEVRREAAAWLAAGLAGSASPARRSDVPAAKVVPTGDPVDRLRVAVSQERIAQQRKAGRLVQVFVLGCVSLLALWTMWGKGFFD